MTLSIIINGHGSKYIFLFLIFNSFILINVTVPEERSATAIGYKLARDTRNKVKHSQDGDIEGNTALQLVSLCDFRFAGQKHLTYLPSTRAQC